MFNLAQIAPLLATRLQEKIDQYEAMMQVTLAQYEKAHPVILQAIKGVLHELIKTDLLHHIEEALRPAPQQPALPDSAAATTTSTAP